MKKVFSLLLFLVMVTNLQAQKCDYILNEKGHKKVMVSVSKLEQVWVSNDNGTLTLGLELTYADIRKEKIMKGDSLILIIGDADFTTLRAKEDAPPVGKADDRVELTSYYPVYDLPEAVLEKLSRNTLSSLKIFFGSKDFNMLDIESKKAKKIMEASACVRK